LAVRRLAIEANIRMDGHTVVSEHTFVNSLTHFGGNRRRSGWIDEENRRLKDDDNCGAKISAAPLCIGWGCADRKHLTSSKGELPEGVVRGSFGLRSRIALMEKLQDLPEAMDERGMVRKIFVRFEKG